MTEELKEIEPTVSEILGGVVQQLGREPTVEEALVALGAPLQ